MKKLLKIFSFDILPFITLILFIYIGKFKEQLIYAKEGTKHTMTGGITLYTWTYRGIYSMILIIFFSSVLYSELSKSIKFIVLLLILIINLPLMVFMELAIYLPGLILVVLIINLIVFIPIFMSLKVRGK